MTDNWAVWPAQPLVLKIGDNGSKCFVDVRVVFTTVSPHQGINTTDRVEYGANDLSPIVKPLSNALDRFTGRLGLSAGIYSRADTPEP